MSRLFLIFAIVGWMAQLSFAQQSEPVKGKHLTAELLSSVASLQAGQPFTVGVRFKMDPKWHTYWINPGDSGQAPSVKWTLPEGFTAGELHFPVPVQFNQPGDILGYGYEDEVVMLARITPPAKLSADEPVNIKANVNWLVCADVCIPGKAELTMNLPVGETIAPSPHAKLIEEWQQQIPHADDLANFGVSQEWSVAPAKAGDDAAGEIKLSWPEGKPAPAKVEIFFPAIDDVTFSAGEVATVGHVATIRYIQRRLAGSAEQPSDLAKRSSHWALAVITDDAGKRSGYPMYLHVAGDDGSTGGLGPKTRLSHTVK